MTVNLTRHGCAPTGVVSALADRHGIDRDFARLLAAVLHRYEQAA